MLLFPVYNYAHVYVMMHLRITARSVCVLSFLKLFFSRTLYHSKYEQKDMCL